MGARLLCFLASGALVLLSVLALPSALDGCLVSIPDVSDGGGPPPPGSCGLAAPAFCETFDTASPGGRSGDLDDSRWNVARIGSTNPPQGLVDFWPSMTFQACGKTRTVNGDNDLTVCGGQLTEPLPGTYLGMRIRQPIDLSSVSDTSPVTLTFNVDAAPNTNMTDYLDVWITDQAIPFVPDFVLSPPPNPAPKNGIGFRFGTCPEMPGTSWIDEVFVSTGGSVQTLTPPFDTTPQADQCFAVAPAELNHIELHFLKSSIELWASDAKQLDTFRMLSSMPTGPLPLQRGYVTFVHTDYTPEMTAQHVWDDIGFDGPFHPIPHTADAPDSLPAGTDGGANLGYSLGSPNGMDGLEVSFPPLELTSGMPVHLDMTVNTFGPGDALYYCINPPAGPCSTVTSTLTADQDAPVEVVLTPQDVMSLVPGKGNVIGNMKMMGSGQGTTVLANLTLTAEVE